MTKKPDCKNPETKSRYAAFKDRVGLKTHEDVAAALGATYSACRAWSRGERALLGTTIKLMESIEENGMKLKPVVGKNAAKILHEALTKARKTARPMASLSDRPQEIELESRQLMEEFKALGLVLCFSAIPKEPKKKSPEKVA